MRIFFISRRSLVALSLVLAAAAVLVAVRVVGGSEAVAAWVQAGAWPGAE